MNDQDFKYVIKDISSTQIGSRFTYEEMLMNEHVPFKFQSIIQLYILKDTAANMMIGQHILELTEDDYDYRLYRQLKLKVNFAKPNPKGGYKITKMPFVEFKEYQNSNWDDNHSIQDITLSNLALMAFTV